MLSKIPPKVIKEDAVFPKTKKKIIHNNNKTERVLTNETLGLQICKRVNASVMKFLGEKEETSDEKLKMLTKVVKSLKAVRKVVIECQE